MQSKKLHRKRYKGVLVSIFVFLVIIISVLVFNFYAGIQRSKDTALVELSGQLQISIQSITRDLFDMKLSYGEDTNSPHVSAAVDRMRVNSEFLTKGLNIIRYGGEVDLQNLPAVTVSPVTYPEVVDNLAFAHREWEIFKNEIDNYTNQALLLEAEQVPIDLAVYQAQGSSLSITRAISNLADRIRLETARNERIIANIQILGISIAIAYYLIFTFFFVRRLRLADSETETARQETTEILDTVNEGLFLLDKDLVIGNQHSQALNKLLGIEHIAGRTLNDLLEQIVTRKDLEVAGEFIQQLFNPRVKAKLISDLNPLDQVRAGIADENGQIQLHHLKFSFSRVYSGQDIIRVLVSVADITKTVMLEERLERERIKNDEQVEMLTAILQVDQRMLESFLRNAHRTTQNINNILRQNSHSERDLREKARLIFREAHSLKGEASAMGLQSFVGSTEELEDRVSTLGKKQRLIGDDFIPLTVSLEQLIASLERVEGLVQKIGSFAAMDKNKKAGRSSEFATLSEKRQSASNYDHYFIQFAGQVAQRNGKKVNVNVHGFDDIRLKEHQVDLVKDLTLQLIRNAVVHGIEDPMTRRDAGKSDEGHINISLDHAEDRQLIQLVVQDDGQGIDYELIKQKLVKENRLSSEQAEALTKNELTAAIFRSGFSTALKSNEDAGRGMGMDVIKARLKDLGGKVKVESEQGKFARFVVRFPIEGRME